MTETPKLLIIDLGSQYTLVIERTLRELGYRSVVLSPKRADEWLASGRDVRGIILSGGNKSVYDADAPALPRELFALGVPLLGICYGMQWLAHAKGGTVRPARGKREYGDTSITVLSAQGPLAKTPAKQPVWASHGDSVTKLPKGFSVLAKTKDGANAAMWNGRDDAHAVWGLQFHPEVTHTKYGKTMLKNFIAATRLSRDWKPEDLISSIQADIVREVGAKKVIFGMSGGVDSTTLGAALAPVLRKRLLGIAIDGGNLRENELAEIKRHAKAAGVTLKVIDAREEFLRALGKTINAEEKRAAFKRVYTSIFIREAKKFGASYVLQGTLAPDLIESGATGGAVIKSHHNVGLTMDGLIQLHPFGSLFKYEVRALAKRLELPETVFKREPFPGPGLFVRVVGTPVTAQALEVVRFADARVREIFKRHPELADVAQTVVAYLGVHTVGVKGDARVYGGAIAVRAIRTLDFMTASGVHLSEQAENEIQQSLIQHESIVRVFFDPTDKPPGTTEFE
ncbi:MAG: glutamine-hydrolyzing GMP synthase [Patescibacteria group bacterium]|nr:glutamine-hydrolyzing GMP synthase [Patescibacteria group bacterium]MDE1965783.1 glutamine-hydrolyzing GMP synthase [Patescibacteria group bacterium]